MSLLTPADTPRRPRLLPVSRWVLVACAGLGLAGSAPAGLPDVANFADTSGPVVATPADIYGSLFRAVQLSHIFSDSKSFADATPRRDPGQIMTDFATRKPRGAVALRRFVLANFIVPGSLPAPPPASGAARIPMLAHIAALWPVLTRQPTQVSASGSALPLPRAYVVPGGRFREIYYWDSYFTMLGLVRDRRSDLVEGMIDDFTSLIERYGHIPNGTRTYYLSRSQPPVYYLMLGLSNSRDPAAFRRRLAALRREHAYWMSGEDGLAPGHAQSHVVRLPDGTILNRYWDARATPREESYAEDVATAAGSGPPATDVYRDLRAAAESGWDFSSRWLANPGNLGSIRTTRIAPVDLSRAWAWRGRRRISAAGRLRLDQRRHPRAGGGLRPARWELARPCHAEHRVGRDLGIVGPVAAAQDRSRAGRVVEPILVDIGGIDMHADDLPDHQPPIERRATEIAQPVDVHDPAFQRCRTALDMRRFDDERWRLHQPRRDELALPMR
jgi:hypothetical protein